MVDTSARGGGNSVNVKIEGLDAIVKDFDDWSHLSHYKPIVKKYTNATATTTQKLMRDRYTGHKEWSRKIHNYIIVHPTGTTRRSTLPHIVDDGMTGYVQAQEKHFDKAEAKYQHNYKSNKKARAKYNADKHNKNKIEQIGKMWGHVEAGTSYFPYLEYGTRKMRARPTLGPAFELRSKQFTRAIDQALERWNKGN